MSEARLARGQYAVEDPNTDPVVMALATPDGTAEIRIPKDRYDPFAIVEMVDGWNRETPLWWRIAILEPGGRTFEVDAPSGDTLQGWQAYAERYHGPGCTVTAIAELPKPPVNLDEALAAACITPEVFRSLLSPEDVADIEAGGRKTIHAYAQSFAEGRIVVRAKPDPASGIVITEAARRVKG